MCEIQNWFSLELADEKDQFGAKDYTDKHMTTNQHSHTTAAFRSYLINQHIGRNRYWQGVNNIEGTKDIIQYKDKLLCNHRCEAI